MEGPVAPRRGIETPLLRPPLRLTQFVPGSRLVTPTGEFVIVVPGLVEVLTQPWSTEIVVLEP